MLESFTTPVLHKIWRGRQPKRMHPRLLFSIRQHLSVLHAAKDLNDLQQAFGNRLQGCYDPSVPLLDDEDDQDDQEAASAATSGQQAGDVRRRELQWPGDKAPQGVPNAEPHPDDPPGRMPDWYRVDVGYGWWIEFSFTDGKARGLELDNEAEARLPRHSGPPRVPPPSPRRRHVQADIESVYRPLPPASSLRVL